MISRTVGAEGIAQKADSAEEMHPEQNEIQPARGPPRDFFSAALECDFLVRLRTRFSSYADPRANSNQAAGFRRADAASAIFSGRSFSRSVCVQQSTSTEIRFSWRLAASLRGQGDPHLLYPRNRVRWPQ